MEQMGDGEAVLVSFAYANRNYWIATSWEDEFVPDFDWGEGGCAELACADAFGDCAGAG